MSSAASGKRVAVLVLGDLARSPRMLNHTRSLVRRGFDVTLIGYREKPLEVKAAVKVIALSPLPRAGDRVPRWLFLIWSAVRMGLVSLQLAGALMRRRQDFILVQNPPSFPALAVAAAVARWSRARLVIDWHNYGFSMLALRLGAGHRMVRLAAWYERRWGRRGDGHLCVSKAFQADLMRSAGIVPRVLYDRPVTLMPAAPKESGGPLTVVCPCGWTADEDVGLLVEALTSLPSAAPTIEVHITGDGPTRAEFAPRLEALTRPGLELSTGFLPEAAYRELLGRADVGLSLHRSSSGLDLAMKVVDFYAAGVPVCALHYSGALPEQVQDGVTGWIFSDARELVRLLERLAGDRALLKCAGSNVAREWKETWGEIWEREASPLFSGDSSGADQH